METNVNYTLVGIFVISLITVIILAVIWLASGLGGEDYTLYKVFMAESVSGLSPDAIVEYNGVNVGTVKRIKINAKVPRIVELLLRVKKSTPVTMGTRASLSTKILTGIALVSLTDDGSDMTPLKPLLKHKYAVIESAPSTSVQLDKAMQKLTRSFDEISIAIRKLLDQTNLDAIRQTLQNIRALTNTLAGNSQRIDEILKNTAEATKQLAPLLKSGAGSLHVIQTQTLPAANQTISNFNAISNNLSKTSYDIRENPAILIRGRQAQLPGPGEK